MKIKDFIIEIADQGLILLCGGKMPAGYNGPYNDKDTPLRNSGHWLIIFAKAYEISLKKEYLEAARSIAEYLISSETRPYGKTFFHRKNPKKDKCNGLIGQAWTIESLVCASDILKEKKYSDVAKKVFLMHRFDAETGLWHILDIKGKNLSFDPTFNHQLWFAAAGSLLNDAKSNNEVECFLDNLEKNISIEENGLIYHPVEKEWLAHKNKIVNVMKNYFLRKLKISDSKDLAYERKRLLEKSIGYHSFNLYAFALLKQKFPNHSIFDRKELIGKIMEYIMSKEYMDNISENRFGFPYNPPGFEIPFALQELANYDETEIKRLSEKWLNLQLTKTYDFKEKRMSLNNEDQETLTARIYEATRLNLNLEIKDNG